MPTRMLLIRKKKQTSAWEGHTKIVKALLITNAIVYAIDEKKQTALHLAELKGHVEIVKAMLAAGAEVYAVDM